MGFVAHEPASAQFGDLDNKMETISVHLIALGIGYTYVGAEV